MSRCREVVLRVQYNRLYVSLLVYHSRATRLCEVSYCRLSLSLLCICDTVIRHTTYHRSAWGVVRNRKSEVQYASRDVLRVLYRIQGVLRTIIGTGDGRAFSNCASVGKRHSTFDSNVHISRRLGLGMNDEGITLLLQ